MMNLKFVKYWIAVAFICLLQAEIATIGEDEVEALL